MKKIMIIAGEPSGDAHAATLVASLNHEACEFYGMGGDKMQQNGVKLLKHIEKITVMGIVEVIAKLPALYQTLFMLKRCLKQNPPDLLILVDFQSFNLKLAKAAKRLGVKTLFYIGPQVWAWRSYRVKKLKNIIDNMAVIFPFEVDFYQKYGMKPTFVGHPSLQAPQPDINQRAFLKQHNIDTNKKIICFLPGSRRHEISKHLPIFVDAIKQLNSANEYEFLVSRYKTTKSLAAYFKVLPKFVKIIDQEVDAMLLVADFAVVASGTATLKTALLKTPMLMIVKVSKLSYFIYKRMIKIPFISIVNIIAGKKIITELVQHQANAARICAEIKQVLSNPTELKKMQQDFEKLAKILRVKPKQSLKSLVLNLLND